MSEGLGCCEGGDGGGGQVVDGHLADRWMPVCSCLDRCLPFDNRNRQSALRLVTVANVEIASVEEDAIPTAKHSYFTRPKIHERHPSREASPRYRCTPVQRQTTLVKRTEIATWFLLSMDKSLPPK